MVLLKPLHRAKSYTAFFSCRSLFLLLLSLSACSAFQIRHPTRHNVVSQTRVASSRNNRDSPEDIDFDGEESSEMYEVSNNSPPQPIRKFTGASSQNLFTNRNNEQSSPSSNLQIEREREFNLASNFERTFGIQAVLLLAAFIYMASVGLAGGITDGSERNFYGEDEVDGFVIEQLERVRTDDAADVILSNDSGVSVRI